MQAHRQPDYRYLMLGLLSAILLVTAAAPLDWLAIVGGFLAVVSLLATAYCLIERGRHSLLCAIVLGTVTFLPLTWFSFYPDTLSSRAATVSTL